MSTAYLQEEIPRRAPQGWRVWNMAITSGADPRWTVVWVKDNKNRKVRSTTLVDLPIPAFKEEVVQRSYNGQRLRQARYFGAWSQRRAAATWIKSVRVSLTWVDIDLTAASFVGRVLADVGGYEPVFLTESGRRKRVTTAWIHNLRKRTWRVTGPEAPPLASLDPIVQASMKKMKVPGAALAVTHEGRLVFARGYTQGPPSQTPIHPRSLFRIGAVSMPITAAGVLRLVEQKRLSLDSTLGELFPELTMGEGVWDKRFRSVSVRDLLHHRGGWDRHLEQGRYDPELGHEVFDPTFAADKRISGALGKSLPITPAMILEYMRTQPLDFEPGDRFAYGHLNYLLLGRVIERISGRSYEEFIQREVFAPMGATDFRIGGSLITERAPREVVYHGRGVAHDVFGRGSLTPLQYGGVNLAAMDSHNGWVTSAVDLARFVNTFQDPNHSPILSRRSIDLMWAPQRGEAYGMGWRLWGRRDDPRANHDGKLPGSWAHVERLPGGTCFVVLFNKNAPDPKLIDQLRDKLAHQKGWPLGDLFR